MLELYYLEEADSICSNRVLMTLQEKHIVDWVPKKMVLLDRDQFKPEYLKINPKAQVPTLVHDGKAIRESSIICDYLDDLEAEEDAGRQPRTTRRAVAVAGAEAEALPSDHHTRHGMRPDLNRSSRGRERRGNRN